MFTLVFPKLPFALSVSIVRNVYEREQRETLKALLYCFPAPADPEVHPQTEDYWGHVNPIGPRACYDEGKRVAETMCYAYMKQVVLPVRYPLGAPCAAGRRWPAAGCRPLQNASAAGAPADDVTCVQKSPGPGVTVPLALVAGGVLSGSGGCKANGLMQDSRAGRLGLGGGPCGLARFRVALKKAQRELHTSRFCSTFHAGGLKVVGTGAHEGVEVRVARIFNTFGPRMHMNDGRVVSNFILQALQGEPLTVGGGRARGECVRSGVRIRVADKGLPVRQHRVVHGLHSIPNRTCLTGQPVRSTRPVTDPDTRVHPGRDLSGVTKSGVGGPSGKPFLREAVPSAAACRRPPAEGGSQTPRHPIREHLSVLCALSRAGFRSDVQSPTGVLVSFREVGGSCPVLGVCGPRRAAERPRLSSSDLVNGLVALMNGNVSSPVNLVSPSPAGRFPLRSLRQHAQGTCLSAACPVREGDTRNRTKRESTEKIWDKLTLFRPPEGPGPEIRGAFGGCRRNQEIGDEECWDVELPDFTVLSPDGTSRLGEGLGRGCWKVGRQEEAEGRSEAPKGNPEEHTILEFAQLIKNLVGSGSEIQFLSEAQDDPQKRKPDIKKAKLMLGWEPVVPLEEGLNKAIHYFRKELEYQANNQYIPKPKPARIKKGRTRHN
ncbi:hypothetical protein J1605_005650 [Eschrichtius robustus]|uniref:UDP-glucuronic acid decarboxylase 1 n=1 Tax=Eschrichtius robustus TaxID=9764 RepID=A0AB34H803_ESCRO|nr:hypothetical protein J1605_005650 [Eschrichtius robustus]